MAEPYLLDPGIDCQQSLCTANGLLMYYMTETWFDSGGQTVFFYNFKFFKKHFSIFISF
jgi:hypothetical protein